MEPVTVALIPDHDTGLYQTDPGAGESGNGSGQYLFVGQTDDGPVRRALLHFDITAAVPSGAVIQSVQLDMQVTRRPADPIPANDTALYAVSAAWTEGPADAGGQEGGGAAAKNGDATWTYSTYPDVRWATPGGDYRDTPSASLTIDALGPYTWQGPGLTADVQEWLDTPAANHGWILVGSEDAPLSARQLPSRENTNANARPRLTITYLPPTGATN